MTFPSTLSTFARPTTTDRLNSPSHSALHNTVSSAVGQLEAVIGVEGNNSVVGTLEYLIKSPASGGGGHVQTAVLGGTGQITFNKGDILIATDSTTLTKLAVGGAGQVLVGSPATATGVQWGSVAGIPASVITVIPKPIFATAASFVNKGYSTNTIGYLGMVNIPFPVSASMIGFMTGDAVTTPGTLDITLYQEDGKSSVFTTTTQTVAIANTSYVSGIGPRVNVPAGNYYLMTNTNGTTNANLPSWVNYNQNPSIAGLEFLTGRPVLQGRYTIPAGAPPPSIAVNFITSVVSGTADSTSNTLYLRIDG